MDLHGYREAGGTGRDGTSAYSHAYIIWGGRETDRLECAQKLAQAIVCTAQGERPCMSCCHCVKASRHIHPDIITIDWNPETRTIYVDQIRTLREDAVIMPNEAQKKVYIISHADAMNVSAQNAILKLLEEPPESAGFILVAENSAELLPTVRSRCVELSAVGQQNSEALVIREDAAAFFEAVCGGPLKLAEFTFALEKFDKNEFLDFIDGAKAYLTAKLKVSLTGGNARLTPEYMMKAVCVLDRAKEYLEFNVGLGHIAGMICAELIKAPETGAYAK